MRRCADADGDRIHRLGRFDRNRFEHAFQHDRKGAGLVERDRVADDLLRFRVAAPARRIATKHIDRLWRQTDMTNHRNPSLDQKRDGFRHHFAAFQLDRGSPRFFQYPGGAFIGFLWRCFIGAERHVDDDNAVITAADDRRAMVAHHLERHRYRRIEPVNHLRERITDQQHVTMRIKQLRRPRGIGGQHHHRFGCHAIDMAILSNSVVGLASISEDAG